jgi:hypothetical protein
MGSPTAAPRQARTLFAYAFFCVLVALAITPGRAVADFGVETFDVTYHDPAGVPMTQAGSHPDMTTVMKFDTTSNGRPVESMRDLVIDLPAGLYSDVGAVPTCTMQEIIDGDGFCHPAAQVGILHYEGVLGSVLDFPVYNLAPADSELAVLGIVVIGFPVKIVVGLREDGTYAPQAKTTNINQAVAIARTTVTLWGVPADPVHDHERFFQFGGVLTGTTGASAGIVPRPFNYLTAACAPQTTTLHLDSWQHRGRWITASSTSPPLTGCDQLDFDARIKARPQSTAAGVPTGYDISVEIPQDNSISGLATPTVRKTVMALPPGVTASPGAADGLGACSDAQMRPGTQEEPACPDSSKIGTVDVETPVLRQALHGEVVLGTPLPDQLMRVWFVIRGPGLVTKLLGRIDPDPVTGQLVTTIDSTPQLPFSRLTATMKGGPRAALTNPKACGTYTTRGTLTPWSGGPSVEATDAFTIDRGCDQASRFEPTLDAGLLDATAGGSSPFVLTLRRPSGQQDVAQLDTTLPAGLLGDVGSVTLCPEPQATSGTCSPASQIGSVRAASGAGPNPLQVPQPGKAPTAIFLAGPYNGAPFSLSIVVPAQAGPFDLGTVVVRAAVFIDRTTAQATVRSDPFPTILKGIPLGLQRMSVAIDRPGFMVSPTSCAPSRIAARVTSTAGTGIDVDVRFQVHDCDRLPFAPALKMALTGKGQTTDDKHPGLTAHLAPRPGDANIKSLRTILPLSLALDPENANGLCEPADAAQDRCPPSSIVGRIEATSLLHEPLRSPIYFVRNERKDPKSGRTIRTLPRLFIPLKGEGVAVDLNARASSPDSEHLVTTFENLPDAPITSADFTIYGGRHGILVVSGTDICRAEQVTTMQYGGQNGKELERDVVMDTPCPLSVRGAGHGRSAVRLTVGGLRAGRVTVSGGGLRQASRTIGGATSVATLNARLGAGARRALARGRDVSLRVTAAFTPKGAAKAQRVTRRVVVHGAP